MLYVHVGTAKLSSDCIPEPTQLIEIHPTQVRNTELQNFISWSKIFGKFGTIMTFRQESLRNAGHLGLEKEAGDISKHYCNI